MFFFAKGKSVPATVCDKCVVLLHAGKNRGHIIRKKKNELDDLENAYVFSISRSKV